MSELIEFASDYEYVLGQLQGNVLNLEAFFNSGAWTRQELDKIREELVEAAHTFAAAQGLGGTRLDGATRAIPSGNGIDFRNDAMDEKGRYYAGHVEYGHRDRGSGFVPARPFMRPAMYAVADASMGRMAGTVERYLQAMWAVTPLDFGHIGNSSYQRKFYTRPNYMNENRDSKGRMKENRITNQNPSKIRKANESYSVHRHATSGYSKDVKSQFGWK